MSHKTTITVTTVADGTTRSVTVTTDSADLTARQILDDLIRPALLAMGYHPDVVAEALGDP